MDGTTDFGNQEGELTVLDSFRNEAIEVISVRTRYLPLYNPQHADASGLLWCVGEALELTMF